MLSSMNWNCCMGNCCGLSLPKQVRSWGELWRSDFLGCPALMGRGCEHRMHRLCYSELCRALEASGNSFPQFLHPWSGMSPGLCSAGYLHLGGRLDLAFPKLPCLCPPEASLPVSCRAGSPCMVTAWGEAVLCQQAPGFSLPQPSPAVLNSPDPWRSLKGLC